MTTNTVPTISPLTAAALTTQINALSLALANMIQGATAPTAASTGYPSVAGLWWHDTTNNQIKVRDQANTTWILIGTLDETAKTFTPPGTAAVMTNVQTFISSGTWTKPSGYAAGSRVFIQGWGAGAGGGKASTAGGGGGGGYNERWCLLSALGATETITIGAGGAARTTNGIGNTGGNTTVGSLLTAYGGSGGSTNFGGAGGGQLSAGGTTAGGPNIIADLYSDGVGGVATFLQGQGAIIAYTRAAPDTLMHGAGGAFPNSGCTAGNSLWGGGGGGGANTVTTAGTSKYGGNGGVGASTTNGGAGVQPGGGGGQTNTGTSSGAGAAGQAIITVFPA